MESVTVIDLQQLCAISICSQAWENTSVLHKVRQLFPSKQEEQICGGDIGTKLMLIQMLFERVPRKSKHTYSDEPRSPCLQEKDKYLLCRFTFPKNLSLFENFQEISHLAEEHNNLIINVLPLKLKIYCQDVLLMMGEKIYFWLEYLYTDVKFNAKLPDKIYWLPNGAVNERKIFEIWEKDKDILSERSLDCDAPILHVLACMYVREDFIKNHQDEMEDFLKIYLPEFQLKNYKDKVYTLIALYLNAVILKQEVIFEKDAINNSGYVVSPTKMFEMCAFVGLSMPVYYFWSIIKKSGYQEEYLMNFIANYVTVLGDIFEFYMRDKMVEIAMFLISQIPFYHRNEFIQENANFLFTGLLSVWPYNKIISQLVKYNFSGSSITTIFTSLHFFMDIHTDYKIKTWRIKHFREVFELFFAVLSQDLIQHFTKSSYINSQINILDMPSLNLMLSYLDRNTRDKIIIEIQPGIVCLVKYSRFEKLSRYMEEVLHSEQERSACKEYLLNYGVRDLLLSLQFDNIHRLFDLFVLTKEEKDVIKKSQDPLKICEYFVITEYRYDWAEMFLEWFFDNEEERDQFRYSLPSYWFIRERISQIWNEILDLRSFREAYTYKIFFGGAEELAEFEPDLYDFRESFGKCFLKEFGGITMAPASPELTKIFLKWVCKEQELRRDINRYYRDDKERIFFSQITEVILQLAEEKKIGQKYPCHSV